MAGPVGTKSVRGVATGDDGIARGWCGRDSIFAAFIVGVPAALLSLAALIGYPLITGDDLIQNLPLEELAGRIVAHGHAPLYDPYIWSGTPLLGGANAHALLPITLLFAVMPPLAAWVLGEVIVIGAAAVGCQLFLRRTGCGSAAAALGGASFGLGGFMSSQIVHIDFAAAAAALPWALVALEGLACRSPGSRRRHCLLLAAATAWVALAGSPDIVVDAVVVCGGYALHLLLVPDAGAAGRQSDSERDGPLRTSPRWSFLGWGLFGLCLGAAIGSLQWWPAALFIDVSQRAEPNFGFISEGSLSPGNLLELLVPHLLGGGPIGLRNYAGTYQLAELDAYPGMVALIAVAVMLRRVRRPEARRWRVWLVVAGIAIALSLGSHTPIERLLSHLPVVGAQRFPSRALISFALAVSCLLGYFLDRLLGAQSSGRMRAITARGEIAAAFVPVAGVLAVVIATVVTGKPAGGALTAQPRSGWSVAAVAPALALSAVLAVVAWLVLVLGPTRKGRAGRESGGRPPRWHPAAAVVALVLADLALFVTNQSSLAPVPKSVLDSHSPLERRLASLAGNGRVLIIDPRLTDGSRLAEAGSPDLGLLSGLAEAGGYSSLMWGPYALLTGTHTEDGASIKALADGTFARLGVRVVLVTHLLAALKGWGPAGRVGPFLAFVDPRPSPLYAIRTAPGHDQPRSAVVRVLSSSRWTGAATLRIFSPVPATLVRDVADIPGWQATVRHGGRVSAATVGIDAGLGQTVRIPAGTSTVSFSYVPPGWRASLVTATAGGLAAAGLALAGLRRRRRGTPEPGPAADDASPMPALSAVGAPSRAPV